MGAFGFEVEFEVVVEEGGVEDACADQVDGACRVEGEGQEGRDDGEKGVADDLGDGHLIAADDGQHRDADFGVVVFDEQRERPEVRGSPDEDDGEERPGHRAEMARHRGPADQRRKRACRAADHDIVPGAALEPHGVDHDIEGKSCHREQGGQQVGEAPQQRPGADHQQDGERQGVAHRDRLRYGRAACGALHPLVDVPVVDHVQRVRCARRHIAAQSHREKEQGSHVMVRVDGDEHRCQCREEQQADDARFGQREIVAPGCGQGFRGQRNTHETGTSLPRGVTDGTDRGCPRADRRQQDQVDPEQVGEKQVYDLHPDRRVEKQVQEARRDLDDKEPHAITGKSWRLKFRTLPRDRATEHDRIDAKRHREKRVPWPQVYQKTGRRRKVSADALHQGVAGKEHVAERRDMPADAHKERRDQQHAQRGNDRALTAQT